MAEAEFLQEVMLLPIGNVAPNPDQPRKTFDEGKLNELADSIRLHGIIEPLIVRKTGDSSYIIIAGERRWRAAQIAGITLIPSIIRNVSEQEEAEIALIENIQRADLNPIEEAEAYRTLSENYGISQMEIAEKVGKSRTAVANTMRLLALSDKVRSMVVSGVLSEGHAKILVALSKEAQEEIAERVVTEHLTVRDAESLARKAEKKKVSKSSKKSEDPKLKLQKTYYEAAARELEGVLNTKVDITLTGSNAGKLTLDFYDLDSFERLYEALKNEL